MLYLPMGQLRDLNVAVDVKHRHSTSPMAITWCQFLPLLGNFGVGISLFWVYFIMQRTEWVDGDWNVCILIPQFLRYMKQSWLGEIGLQGAVVTHYSFSAQKINDKQNWHNRAKKVPQSVVFAMQSWRLWVPSPASAKKWGATVHAWGAETGTFLGLSGQSV